MHENVTVFGAGYVGLVAGVCLAHSGHAVRLVEVDPEKLRALRAGETPIHEPGVTELLAEGISSGRLTFAHVDDVDAVDGLVIIAVGTPPAVGGSADLRYVRAVVDRVLEIGSAGTIVVMKSTVPPGTGRRLTARLAERGCLYVSSPEFLREGSAIEDWYHTDRVVIGGQPEAVERVRGLYAGIDAPVLTCDVTSAEMIKYASNAFLATKISFINEIASLCDRMGAQIDAVAEGVGMDRRIGGAFLNAGIGYGGSCFPKDTRALDFLATVNGGEFPVLRAVIAVNARQRVLAVRTLKERLGELDGRRVAVLGLTFKPSTDDTREAPASEIIAMLLSEGADVVAYNPIPVTGVDPGATVVDSIAQAVTGCDAVVVATEWNEMSEADWGSLVASMRAERLVFDGRNCLDPKVVSDAGGMYVGVGRPMQDAPR
jgi:UDPglucose 6-dehydrogenase